MNKKLLSLSGLIICFIIAFLYWSSLQLQTQLPSEYWSRPFQVDTLESNFSKLQNIPEEDGYTISLLDFKKLIVLSCDQDMLCKENRTIDSLNTYKNTWSDKTDSYYIRDDSLIHKNNSLKETVIASNVANFTKTGETIVYWTDDRNLTMINSTSTSEKRQFQMDDPITTVIILDNQTFVVTEDKNNELYKLYSLANEINQLFQFQLNATEFLSSLHILEQPDNSYSLLIDIKIGSAASSTKNIKLANFDLSLNQSPTFNKLSFVDSATGIQLKTIQFPRVFQGEHESFITFSSTYFDLSGEKVTKIFVGNLSKNLIQANALTKSDARYERSMFLNEQTVAYLKMKGANRSLEYSSTDVEKLRVSKGIMDGDYKGASYILLSKSFNGLLLILFSFTWLIITFPITYGLLLLLQKRRFALRYKTAFIVHLIALFSIQSYFLYRFTSVDSIIYNIPYITEAWQFPMILIVSAILSIIPLFILRYKLSEDTFTLFVLYTSFMNLIILYFLVGSYMF